MEDNDAELDRLRRADVERQLLAAEVERYRKEAEDAAQQFKPHTLWDYYIPALMTRKVPSCFLMWLETHPTLAQEWSA